MQFSWRIRRQALEVYRGTLTCPELIEIGSEVFYAKRAFGTGRPGMSDLRR
jgi:hypothetical protein